MALEALRERRSPEGDESLADMTDLRTLVRTGFQLDELGEVEKSLRKLQQVGRRLVGADDEETTLYAARLAAERGAWEESISLHDEAWSRAEASLARALRAAQPPAEEDARDFHALERILITVAPVRRARGMQAAIVTSRGDVAAARGNWPAAEQEYDRALKLVEVGLGPKSSLVVSPLTGLSHAARLTGGLERARSLAQRAVDIAGEWLPEADAVRVSAVVALAQAEQAAGRRKAALALLEALPQVLSRARLRASRDTALAQALAADAFARDRASSALQSAEQALSRDGALGNPCRQELARVRAKVSR